MVAYCKYHNQSRTRTDRFDISQIFWLGRRITLQSSLFCRFIGYIGLQTAFVYFISGFLYSIIQIIQIGYLFKFMYVLILSLSAVVVEACLSSENNWFSRSIILRQTVVDVKWNVTAHTVYLMLSYKTSNYLLRWEELYYLGDYRIYIMYCWPCIILPMFVIKTYLFQKNNYL